MEERPFYEAARDMLEFLRREYLAGRPVVTRRELTDCLGERSHLAQSVADWWERGDAIEVEPGTGGYCYRIHPGVLQQTESTADKPILSETAAAAYEILCGLPEHRGMTGPELLTALDKAGQPIEQSGLTSRIIPELKSYGIENEKRKGYRIPASKRPREM